MKKKLISLLLVSAMAAATAGCGSSVPANSVNSRDDLPGKKIGVQLGTTGDSDATEYEKNDGSTVERYNKGADAIQALKTGKIDCVIIDQQPAEAFVEKNDDLKILSDTFDLEEYAICIAKGNSDLTDKFNSAIEELQKDGTIDSITSNYIGDEAGKHPYETPDGTEYPNGTLTMATNAQFDPYEYYDGDQIVGIDADIAKEICDKLGYEMSDRYLYLLRGLGNTLLIAALAVILGIVLGFLVAIIRSTHDKHGGLNILNFICKVYLTIWRGTPTMVQLLIMYYIILVALDNKILVAVIAFGLNSAAYVAEIVRSGIMSVDEGQFEAGRSLGLNYTQTMRLIILPQAFKNVLPALANEFITLLKETSISGYIAIPDLTKGGDIIRSQTYDAFLPLFGVAVIYLVLVMILTAGVHKLETRLRTNER